ncbi:MAG: flippase [Acidobacteria bacterium]|nr:flippase [Acidobacteriota bacterium]
MGEGSNVLLFLLGFVAARILGPVSFGEYGAAFAFVGLFRILPDFGMSYASTLAVSRERSLARAFFGNLLGFQAVLSALTLGLCLGIGRALFDGVTWTAVVVLSADLLLKSLQSTLRWLLKAFEHFGAESLTLVLERGLILALGTGVLLLGYGVAGFVLVFALVRAVDTVGLYAWIHRRVVPLRPSYRGALWWELFRKGLPFAYAGAMITLFFQVDAVMLEQMRGAKEVGWYAAPVRVLEGLTLVPRILGYALIPTMAALHVTAPGRVTELYRRGSKYLLLVGLPVAAFGALASDRFIPFLFGEEYGPSVPAARLLLPAAAFMFLSNLGETTLACVGRWGTIVVVSTLSLLLNVTLNLLWIPTHGCVGAAAATLATEATYFVLTAVTLRTYGHRASWARLASRPLAATCAFGAVLWLCRPLPLLAGATLACTAYAAAVLLLRVWDDKERELLREMLRGTRPGAGDLA